MMTFLAINGIKINVANDELVGLGLGIAEGKLEYEDILNWVSAHRTTK